VKHRYSAFAALHDILVNDHGVAKDLLPPKKVIGNQDPVFIEKRRAALETYLQTVMNFLKIAMPQELAYFLHFHQYEVLYLLQSLALQFFNEGDLLLQNSTSFKFTPLQVKFTHTQYIWFINLNKKKSSYMQSVKDCGSLVRRLRFRTSASTSATCWTSAAS